jgi:hypothetical protein
MLYQFPCKEKLADPTEKEVVTKNKKQINLGPKRRSLIFLSKDPRIGLWSFYLGV